MRTRSQGEEGADFQVMRGDRALGRHFSGRPKNLPTAEQGVIKFEGDRSGVRQGKMGRKELRPGRRKREK